MKATCGRQALLSELQVVARRGSHPRRDPGAVGRPARDHGHGLRAGGDRYRDRAFAPPSRRASSNQASCSCRRGCWSTSSVRSRAIGPARAARRGRRGDGQLGARDLLAADAARRRLPADSRGTRRGVVWSFRRRLSPDDRACRQGRLAGRDAARADRHPGVGRGPASLRMVATDSYRLSVKETPLDGDGRRGLRGERARAGAPGARPRRSPRPAPRRSRLPRATTRSCSASNDMTLSSRLIDGQFPNYRQLLPETYEHELRVSRDELLAVVRRVSIMAQRTAPLRLRFEEGEVTRLGPDARRRRGPETVPVNYRARRSRSASTPSSSRTASTASSRTSWCSS